ncbi:hypothetical protein BP6252_09458 [Coleophoma cylindrospora]|uniref:DUF7779 domain-containing protein n=1 Tax=Coleophoma cylindrospora TaxID=1849047 RepID=A0A3D8R1Y8_9HELO|nr:hypothetical protein BP6252_09458 [Coleophoma cylindrospora]
MASTITFGDANSGFQAGIVNGPASAEFHYHVPPERPETPPNPSAVIPFDRDTDFVEQGSILEQIHQKCAVLGYRTALVGLGGVGKSQLAIQYAYQARERSPKIWVFWVHASNAARFEQSFRDIADYVKIYGRHSPKADIFQLVCNWLRDDRKEKWILILDNVDDASFLVEARGTGKDEDEQTNGIESTNARPLVSYLPHCPMGSILITTRSKIAALKLVEERNIISVEPMSKGDALLLFKNKLREHSIDDDDDAAELTEVLEFMPLAIVQAAANISQRAPRYSVRKYLEDFQKSDRNRISLLDFEGGQLRRDQEAKNSIIITWQISFDHIREIRRSAADLLSLMSFFDRQGIPEDLLRDPTEQKENSEHEASNNNDDEDSDTSQSSVDDGFEDDVLMLRNYAFISIDADCTAFEMHALVQLATRKWLEVHGLQERWKEKFIRNLAAGLPTGEYENWERCQVLFPHTQSAAAQKPKENSSLEDWASILYKAAWYAWRIGNGLDAEKMSYDNGRFGI